MRTIQKISANCPKMAAPHLASEAQVGPTQPQAVILLPVDEFLHMKEELIQEVRTLGAGNNETGSSMKEVMTPKEAADILGISVKHLMELRKARKIACSEDGRIVRFLRSHVIEYLTNHSKSAK